MDKRTCEQIVADCEARRAAMTQAERDAEDLAALEEEDENFNAWAEASAAQYFNLSLSEYRESRQSPPPDPAMWNERDAEAHFGPNPYRK